MNNTDTAMLRLMIESAAANLSNKRKQVDDLNVFPVPDGDTGTNMSLTFGGAAAAVSELETDSASVLMSKLASASLRNARGNSGVILSQIIRGFARGVEGKDSLGIDDIKNALAGSRKTAYRAVMKPTEGTILTVIREISEFADGAAENFDDIGEFMHAVLEAGQKSLRGTTELLPALRQAGVVDAGGMGLITLIEGALFAFDNGKTIESAEPQAVNKTVRATVQADIRFLYCTEFIINKTRDRQVAQFRSAIREKGDCMLVIDDEEIVKVHIHTNHPGYVIEQALKLGELTNLKIDNMKYQHNEKISDGDAADTQAEEEKPKKKYGFAAVSSGSGLAEMFRSLNVDEIIEGGQTMNPSTQELLDSVEKIPAETVFILPNNKNIILAAEQVDALSKKQVVVVPTVNIPQGIAAMMAFDESQSPSGNASEMQAMAEAVSCGQVTYAARDTELDGFDIHEGDCLGICGKDITDVTETPEEAAEKLAARMVTDDSAVVSVYYGEGVDKEKAEEVCAAIGESFPDLDVSPYYGGQPVYCYIISVE